MIDLTTLDEIRAELTDPALQFDGDQVVATADLMEKAFLAGIKLGMKYGQEAHDFAMKVFEESK